MSLTLPDEILQAANLSESELRTELALAPFSGSDSLSRRPSARFAELPVPS